MNSSNQKDLVLSINEYAYVLDETKGQVTCLVGPTKMSLSQSDRLVNFNERTKAFETCGFDEAKHLFTTAPENWYVILKNPVDGNRHPNPGTSNSQPEGFKVGRKVNIKGPASFALYPGQMAKVIRGHALRSNQYLLARVYEADSANSNEGEMINAEGQKVQEGKKNYVNGQILVIKGTEVSFYIPPTGIEVIPIEGRHDKGYVREAITLERLEYCILKDEDGNKRYVHGPEVVFPRPTETFVASASNSYIFRAIELSKISGIYVKVIAEHKDEKEVVHPVGEELFITGNDQMIYYPRPEHAIINYDGKILHHAIAIPEGEGRYIMDRMTGEIKTVKGPKMYLPDPRFEVVVKRKLTPSQCQLWYPGNMEVLNHNLALNEKAVEKSTAKNTNTDSFGFMASAGVGATLANLEAKANISRGTSYTKPRTITLDNKFDGVVSMDIWTGYAVNVISKSGERKVICGPQTVLLDYDQTLEVLQLSTGKPKTTETLEKTVFLRHENNKVSDIVAITTKDFVDAHIKVSYCVNFDPKAKDKWFSVENYVKFLCDALRAEIRREAKKYNIEEFYQNYADVVREIVLNLKAEGEKAGRYFPQNGMKVVDCEVLGLNIESEVESMLEDHQREMVKKSLQLTGAKRRVEVAEKLAEAEKKEHELRSEQLKNKMELQAKETQEKLKLEAEINRKREAEKVASMEAEKALQPVMDAIQDAKLARDKKETDAQIAKKKADAEIEKARLDAQASTIAKVMESIGPDLVAAMSAEANADILTAISSALAPYAMAKGESVAEFTDKLLRGTTLEGIVTKAVQKND
jgi:major vault protein